jgi:Mg2+ and Co2+ transporter CorA
MPMPGMNVKVPGMASIDDSYDWFIGIVVCMFGMFLIGWVAIKRIGVMR